MKRLKSEVTLVNSVQDWSVKGYENVMNGGAGRDL